MKQEVWINNTAAPGVVTINGKQHQIGTHKWSHNEELECKVLGCILAAGGAGNGQHALKQIAFLRYRDFFFHRNGIIYWAMQRLFKNEIEIDIATVAAELRRHKHEDKTLLHVIGGEPYLVELSNIAPVNLESYARVIVDCALQRATIVAADVIQQIGMDNTLNAEERAHEIQMATRDLLIRSHTFTEQNTYSMDDFLDDYTQNISSQLDDDHFEPGIPTGFAPLDKALTGWARERLYMFAAPTGWGKTSFFISAALNALRQGKRVLYISLEMPINQMMDRMMCNWASIDSMRYLNRKITPEERQRFHASAKELKALEMSKAFMMVRLKWPTMQQIRAKLDELELDPGFDLVILDYVSVNTISGGGQSDNDNFQLMSSIYTELEKIKQDFNIPLIVGTQMNKRWQTRKRQGLRPELGDLMFGSIGEFAADAICFIYHPWKVDDLAETDMSELIFRKNRCGPVGDNVTAYLNWEPEYMRFSDDEGALDLVPVEGGD